ncbi:MAG: hypothetical protein IJM71_03945 [Clostridia bacterium]|nr:hypothetical protein [Clostridia bacterium]
MKKLRILAIVMAAVLTLALLVSCGGTKTPAGSDVPEGSDAPSDEVKGAMDEHGYYKVFVPEGCTLKHEDFSGSEDPKSFRLLFDEDAMAQLMFGIFDRNGAEMGVEATKSSNEGAEDVTLDLDGVKWTGVAYDYSGKPCFQIYADFDGSFVTVNGTYVAYDSAIVKTVLGSLEVNVPED